MVLRLLSRATPVGMVPTPEALDTKDLHLSGDTMRELFKIDSNEWRAEVTRNRGFFNNFKNHLPPQIAAEGDRMLQRLDEADKKSKQPI